MHSNHSRNISLAVNFPTPSITPTPDTVSFYAGTNLTLSCNYILPSILVEAAVQPVVTWMVNGRAVDTTSDRISTEGDTLTFSSLATSNTGRYTCELTVAEDMRYVTVQETPELRNIAVHSKCIPTCVHASFFFSLSPCT